jgi:uncharacterized membrane protein YkoI
MKTTRYAIAHRLLVPALAVLAGTLLAQEKNDAKLTIDIPTAVQATIRQEQGDGKVNDFRRVNENDGTTYIVGLLIDGKNYSLALDAAGRVMSKVPVEETDEPAAPTVESLPAAIKKTLFRESNGAPVTGVEVRQKMYAFEIKVGKRKYAIEIDEHGKLVRKQYIGDDDGN